MLIVLSSTSRTMDYALTWIVFDYIFTFHPFSTPCQWKMMVLRDLKSVTIHLGFLEYYVYYEFGINIASFQLSLCLPTAQYIHDFIVRQRNLIQFEFIDFKRILL